MFLAHLKLSTTHLHKDINLLVPNSGNAVEHIQGRSNATVSIAGISRMRKVPPLVIFVNSCMGLHCCRAMHASITTADTFHGVESCSKDGSHLLKGQFLAEDIRGDNYCNLAKSSNYENEREMQRRRKIGLANKGKVPWNKGRKHSEETREIIRQKTKEALRDPKVRKKMSECPRSLSNQTKARIRRSLQKLWGQRLKWKRSREKFLQLWAESIARAAKTGGIDQQELEWDSYEKMQGVIALQQLEWAADVAKEKEMARIRAERAAKVREDRNQRLAQKKKEREERAKVRGQPKKRKRKKSKEEKEELAVTEEFKLKAKLMKIHKQKSIISQISSQHQRIWENLDMKFKRIERKEVTLADQISLAKVRRAESLTQ